MNKLKISILSLFAIVMAFMGASCSEEVTPVDYAEVTFGIQTVENPKETGLPIALAAGTPARVKVKMNDASGTTLFNEYVELLNFNGQYVSSPVTVPVGTYSLVEYYVVDETNIMLYATPSEGSELASAVNDPLPIEVVISKNTTTMVTPEVVAVEEGSVPEDFGMVNFGFIVVPTDELTIAFSAMKFVSNNWEPQSGTYKIYANDAAGAVLAEGELVPGVNFVPVDPNQDISYYVETVVEGVSKGVTLTYLEAIDSFTKPVLIIYE